MVVNGRPEGDRAERALGLFLNTVPCRMRLGGGSWLELARAAFAWERTVLPFRRFPVAELQRMRGGTASVRGALQLHPLPQADGVAVKAGRASARGLGVGGTSFPFGATFEVAHGEVNVSLEYDAARFSDAEAEAARPPVPGRAGGGGG